MDWGLTQMRWGRGPEGEERKAAEWARFARPADYVLWFQDLRSPFPRYWAEWFAARGTTAIVSLEIEDWHDRGPQAGLTAVANGEYDEHFAAWAREAADWDGRILMRFGYEFNGDWFPWGGDPETFIAAWRRVHGVMQAAGAHKVEWVWSANFVSIPDTPENAAHHYFPGRDVVDWLGVDGYNFGDHHDEWHQWDSFSEAFDRILDDFEARFPDLPLIITEFGCAPGESGAPGDAGASGESGGAGMNGLSQRAAWIHDAYAQLQTRRQVHAALWFNLDKSREGEPNWRLVENDGSLAAFNATFARPRGD